PVRRRRRARLTGSDAPAARAGRRPRGAGAHRGPPHRTRGGSGRRLRHCPTPRKPGQRPARHQEITMTRPPRPRRVHGRRFAVAALAATLMFALTACFGSAKGGDNDNPNAKVTITFWHGWSAPNEVAAINANIKAFEKLHPNITVKAVGNITD